MEREKKKKKESSGRVRGVTRKNSFRDCSFHCISRETPLKTLVNPAEVTPVKKKRKKWGARLLQKSQKEPTSTDWLNNLLSRATLGSRKGGKKEVAKRVKEARRGGKEREAHAFIKIPISILRKKLGLSRRYGEEGPLSPRTWGGNAGCERREFVKPTLGLPL